MAIGAIGLAQIAQVVSVGSAVIGTIGQMQAASYQASVAARNQEIAEENARRASNDAQLEQIDASQDAAREIGALIAEQSASGISLSSGSSLLRRRDLQEYAQRDSQRIREQGNVNIRNFKQQAADFASEREVAKASRSNAFTGGLLNIGSSYIGGATAVRKAKAAKVTRT